jgi:hypothetical protein
LVGDRFGGADFNSYCHSINVRIASERESDKTRKKR